jgi:hypothetical protein
MHSKLHDSLPALLFAIFIIIANTANGLHYDLSIPPTGALDLVYAIGIFWGLSWWPINDSQKYGWKWHLDWGILLYVVGWLLVPFYLFKTRGRKAFLIILLFAGLYFGSHMFGLVSGAVVSKVFGP